MKRESILTIGQYLQPGKKYYPVQQYINPKIFKLYEITAKKIGIKHVFSSSDEIRNLLRTTKPLSVKITSLCRLLLLGKWIAITDSFESLLQEEALLQENTDLLEFYLSA